MTDVVLLRPATTYGEIYLPWSFMYLAAPLVRKGYSVRIIDQNTEPDWRETLARELAEKPLCMGTGAFTGKMIEGAVEATRLAGDAGVTTVWGGVHASLLPEQTLQDRHIDYVVVGEGEVTFEQLVDHLAGNDPRSPADIPGLAYTHNGTPTVNSPRPHMNLDELAPTPWHLTDAAKYFHDRGPRAPRFMDFCGSRGCPFSCGFCYNVGFHNRKWRGSSVEVFFEKVKEMVERFDVKGFVFMDDYFFANMNRIREFSELLLKNNIEIVWDVQCRLDAFDKMDDDTLSLFQRAGLWRFHFGMESGNPDILEMINKQITVDMAIRAGERVERFGISSGFYFMLGFPGETPEQMLDTYGLMDKLTRDKAWSFIMGPYIYSPYPGTPLFDKAVEAGFVAPASIEGWADTEGWGELLSPHVPRPTRYFMNVSKKYFRGAFLYPKLKPFYNARMALFRKWPRASSLEWWALRAAEFTVRKILTRLNLKRWANR